MHQHGVHITKANHHQVHFPTQGRVRGRRFSSRQPSIRGAAGSCACAANGGAPLRWAAAQGRVGTSTVEEGAAAALAAALDLNLNLRHLDLAAALAAAAGGAARKPRNANSGGTAARPWLRAGRGGAHGGAAAAEAA